MQAVRSVADLEALVGTRPLASMLKSIDLLDDHCLRLLSLSTFAVVGYADAEGHARATTAGGDGGFVEVLDPNQLRVPLSAPITVDPAVGVGLLFFVPGLGETLRVNGRARVEGEALVVTVEEAFAHCAKAFLRSSFWTAAPSAPFVGGEDEDLSGWISRTAFVVLTSWDASGRADASPKGDPSGFMRLVPGGLAIPDRPGNRRTDTFHNVVEQPKMALLALLPHDERVLEVSGVGALSSERSLLATMAVHGKTPKVALLLEPERVRVSRSRAVADARLWDSSRHVPASELPDMADVFIDHVKLNREEGMKAKVLRSMANKRVMGWALTHDYENNRY